MVKGKRIGKPEVQHTTGHKGPMGGVDVYLNSFFNPMR